MPASNTAKGGYNQYKATVMVDLLSNQTVDMVLHPISKQNEHADAAFMVAWNDYLFASIFLSSASNVTLPVGLNALFSTPDYIWGRMMAASLVTALPVGIMYALSERFIKSGLTAGGVKG